MEFGAEGDPSLGKVKRIRGRKVFESCQKSLVCGG